MAGALAVIGLTPFLATRPPPGEGLPQPVTAAAAIGLALISAALVWTVAGLPYLRHSWQHDRVRQGIPRDRLSRARRGLRRRSLEPEDLPVARFWVIQNRTALRIQTWMGFIWATQVLLGVGRRLAIVWILLGVIWLATVLYVLSRERLLRLAEAGCRPEGEAG